MTVLWISAYTLSLCNTLFVLYIWTLNKNKAVFALFLLVLNVFCTTAVPFISLMLNGFSLFSQLLLYIFVAGFSVSVPHFIFSSIFLSSSKTQIPRWYCITIFFCICLFCVLYVLGFTYSVVIAFSLPLLSIVSTIGLKKTTGEQSNEQKRLSATGKSLFLTASSLFLVYVILRFLIPQDEIVSVYFFGFFPIAYQVPVLLYNIRSLKMHLQKQQVFIEQIQKSAVVSAVFVGEKLSLSKREAETAIKLYEGKTYNQIADELFVSLSAVKKHAYNIYRKLEITNNRQLMQKINDIL